jgi:hypothetical protein
MSQDKLQLFVSYSHADRDFGRQLIADLRRHHFIVHDSDEISPRNWSYAADQAIKAANAVILVVGVRDEPGEFQRSQWRAALEEIWRSPNKRLIPVLLDNARIPSFLANYRVLRVNSGAEPHAFSKLLLALKNPQAWSKPVPTDEERSRERSERLDYIGKVATSLKSE